MASFSRIKGEESSTTTFKAATVTQTRNSSVMHQELISLADAESSLGIARVLAAEPVSTEFGLGVRIISGPSSGADLKMTLRNVFDGGALANVQVGDNANSAVRVNVVSSSKAGAQFSVYQSTASDLNVTVAGYSTIVSVANTVTISPVAGSTFNVRPLQSSAADLQATVTPVAGSTWNVRPLQSSAADLQMTATPLAGSTWNVRPLQSSAADLQVTATPAAGSTWAVRPLQSSASDLKVSAFLFDSTGNAIDASTQSMSSGARGIFVRPVIPGSTTYAASTAGQSTLTALFSSAAATRPYVYAYSLTSTNTSPVDCAFCISSGANAGSTIWIVRLQANSSGVTGANMAVAPPGYLFRGSTGQNMTFNVTSSVVGGISLSVAAFRSS